MRVALPGYKHFVRQTELAGIVPVPLSSQMACPYYSDFAGRVVIVREMANPQPRSAGVTAAATFAILICASAFFFWGYVLLKLVNTPVDDAGNHIYQLRPMLVLGVALIPPSLIALGIRTAIGLFQLRSWARLATMIWAALSLVVSLGIVALRPFETFFISDRFIGPVESLKQLIVIAFLTLLLPASVWWLFLFRMKSVKAQFLAAETED
jgi:hypothetical protein